MKDSQGENIYPLEIIESGTSSNGTYIKYADGTMIQTKSLTTTFKFLVWYGQIAYQEWNLGNWIVPFVDNKPIFFVSDHIRWNNNYNNQGWMTNAGNFNYSNAGVARCVRPADDGLNINFNVTITRTCFGYWK